MSIFDIFKSVPAVSIQPPVPQTAQQKQMQVQNAPNPNLPTGNPSPGQPLPGTVANQSTAPNGVIPVQQEPVQKPEDQSPFKDYADMWQPGKAPDAEQNIFANLDPAKVFAAAQKVDFTKNIPAELIQKAAAGGPEGIAALMQVINSASQGSYAQGTMGTAKIVETALAKQREEFLAEIPGLIKKHSVNENLQQQNPLLADPAVQPMIQAMTQLYQSRNPNASEAEIQRQVMGYMQTVGDTFARKPTPTAEDQRKNKASESYDFSAFLTQPTKLF